jgi:drug/metabolite transporter (DMT)-like permease
MTRLKAEIMLLAVTFFWSVSYLLMDICLAETGPLALNAMRFLGAFAIAFLATPRKFAKVNAMTVKYSAVIGGVLVAVYIGATYGVMYTSLSNAGFLCGLTVVITPVIGFAAFRKRPERKLAIVLAMALTGIALLTLGEDMRPAPGDILCIMCAFAYAVDLLITERAVKSPGVDAYQLGVVQLGFTGAAMLALSIAFEGFRLPSSLGAWAALAFLSVFCTGAAFIIQAVAQQYTDASRAGVIFALEPVFAGVAAFVFAHEVLSGRAYLGAFLMVAGVMAMEVDIAALRRRGRRGKK